MMRRTTHNGWRRLLAPWVIAALVVVFAGACRAKCGGGEEANSDASGPQWPLRSTLRSRVPTDARAVTFVRKLRDLRTLATVFARSAGRPNVDSPSSTKGRSADGGSRLGFVPSQLDFEQFGLAPDAEALLFARDGRLGGIVPLEDERAFRKAIGALASAGTVDLGRPRGGSIRQIKIDAAPKSALQYRIGDGVLLARTAPPDPPQDPAVEQSLRERFDAFFENRKTAWPRNDRTRQALEKLGGSGARAVGVIRPSEWLSGLGSDPQARILMARLSNQIGPVAFRAEYESETRTASVEFRGLSKPGEPVVVERLGTATGELPPLGGLVQPGVLGVLHLSVDPKAVYRVLNSALPAPRREQLDVFWRHARQRLEFHGPDALLENLTGHAVFVFYGLESERLSGSPIETLRALLELRATREAVLLPIKSRKRAERVLDKLTQMTRGQLSRQQSEHAVEYAWFDKGELEWALILQDEHLLFVDSATSNAKAHQYEQRGRPLSRSQLREMHLTPLLVEPRRSGLFVDTGTLSNLLRENGHGRVAEWLRPIRSLVVTTGMDGEVSHTRIELRLDQP